MKTLYLIVSILYSIIVVGCSHEIQPCTKYIAEFFDYAADENMNMGKNVIETNRIIFAVFNDKEVRGMCLVGTNANFNEATKCTSSVKSEGVCRYKDGRFMGYSYGRASAQDLLQDVK